VHTIVCIKQVPETSNVRMDEATGTMLREGVESIVNPLDLCAVEAAIRLKEAHGGRITALSMGPKNAQKAVREALAMGCDEGVLLCDRAFAGADTLATGYTLAAGIRKLGGADIILMGRQAIDGDTGQVGPGVAENLGIPHITDIKKIEGIDEDGTLIVQRAVEDGYVRLKTRLPVVLTVVKEINEPRLPSLKTKMQARKKEIKIWSKDDLEVDADRLGLDGSPTWVTKIFTPPKSQKGKLFSGDKSEAVAALIKELRQAGIEPDKNRRILENAGN